MTINKLLLTYEHEFEGYWWTNKDEKQHSGRIRLAPRKMDLNLHGDAKELLSFYDESSSIIYGRAIDGTLFTITSFARGGHTEYSRSGSGERLGRFHIHVNQCIVGTHIRSSHELLQGNLQIGFSHLERWFAYSPIERGEVSFSGDEMMATYIVNSGRSLFDHELSSINMRLRSFHSVSTSSTFFTKLHVDCKAYIVLTLRDGLSCQDVIKKSIEICSLWSILSGAWCQVQHVQLFQQIEEDDEDSYQELQFYFIPPFGSTEERTASYEMLFTNDEISPLIGSIFEKWWSRSAEVDAVSTLYLNAFKEEFDRSYDILHIVDYVNALDIVSRKYGRTYITDKGKIRAFWKEACALIDNKFLSPENDELKEKGNFINHRSLRRKICSIREGLCEDAKNAFDILDESTVGKLVHTRNYFAHFDDKLREKIVGDDELFALADKCRSLVLFYLLDQLGINQERIIERMRKVWSFSHTLKPV